MNTNRLLLALCLAAGALLSAACSSGSTQTKHETAKASDSVGVAECDQYLAAYEACLNDKVPEAARATMKASFEQTRNAWRQAAATAEGRAGLASACKTARDAARQAMTSYGCNF
jgi:DNA-binding FadR family transcriptional regulator